jgi:hypothetical protein
MNSLDELAAVEQYQARPTMSSAGENAMAKKTPCQRPDCDNVGKPRTMTDPASGKKVKVRLCDEDYKEARATEPPPLWLSELLTHIALVG